MTEIETRVETLRRRLGDSGHRITPQRLCILEALVGANSHPSAEEIYAQVRRVSPTTSLATVYKTLETLRDLGEVLEMEVGQGRRHFDGVRPQFHPHAVCVRCGRIVDVELGGLADLPARAASASAYQIQSQRVEFYGLCPDCQTQDYQTRKDLSE